MNLIQSRKREERERIKGTFLRVYNIIQISQESQEATLPSEEANKNIVLSTGTKAKELLSLKTHLS